MAERSSELATDVAAGTDVALVGLASQRLVGDDAAHGGQAGDRLRWLLLDTVQKAFVDAGSARSQLAGEPVGVFLSAVDDEGAADAVSWFFDLRGPSETIGAGPTGLLLALHRARGALLLGECTMVVAGGQVDGCLVVVLLELGSPSGSPWREPRAWLTGSAASHLGRAARRVEPAGDSRLKELERLLRASRSAAERASLVSGAGGVRVRVELLLPERAPTLQPPVDPLPEAGPAARHDPIVAIQPDGSAPPTFWIHGVSGDVGWVMRLARSLGHDMPIFGIEASGFDGRGAILDTVEAMAAHYVEGLLAKGVRGPVWLGGYSGGGMLALETSRQLQAKGVRTERLVLLDANAPGNTSLANAYIEGFIFLLAGSWYGHLWGASQPLDFARLKGLDREGQIEQTLDYLFECARPPLSRAAIRQRLGAMDRICQATRRAMESYAAAPLVPSPEVVLVRCRQGLGNHASRFRIPEALIDGDYREGWEALFDRPLAVHEIDCDHWSLLGEPWIDQAASAIRAGTSGRAVLVS